jgi:hypothetical protein
VLRSPGIARLVHCECRHQQIKCVRGSYLEPFKYDGLFSKIILYHKLRLGTLYFVDRASWGNSGFTTNLTHFFTFLNVFIFLPVHVSSDKRSSSGGNNCINTSSSITHWQGDCPTCWSGEDWSPPDQCVIPDDVLIQLFPPDDEHLSLETCGGRKANTLKKVRQVGYMYLYVYLCVYVCKYVCVCMYVYMYVRTYGVQCAIKL